MSELDLDAIEARAAKRSDPNRTSVNDLVRLQDVDGRLVAVWRREFVDNAHDDIAALVSRVRELEAELAEAKAETRRQWHEENCGELCYCEDPS
ncbi:hypothetical protein SEA_WHITNEY_94 [Gordonia phage Whitney]|nr:hypothetical protein SEA_WHITNEY_94 [Gordonia phage Whitney]